MSHLKGQGLRVAPRLSRSQFLWGLQSLGLAGCVARIMRSPSVKITQVGTPMPVPILVAIIAEDLNLH